MPPDEFAANLAALLEAYLRGQLTEDGVVARITLGAEPQKATEKVRPSRAPSGAKSVTHLTGIARKLFNEWVEITGKSGARPTQDRLVKVVARLREGYTEDEIRLAIKNVSKSDFHRGENDRGREYVELSMICRTGELLERYRDMDVVAEPPSTVDHAAEAALLEGRLDEYERLNADRHRGGVGANGASPARGAGQPRGVPAGGGALPHVVRLAGIPRKANDRA